MKNYRYRIGPVKKSLLFVLLGLPLLSFARNGDMPVSSGELEISAAITDTIHIGPDRTFTSLNDYFSKSNDKDSIYILIDEGTYYTDGTWIDGSHITIEGIGQVNLYCTILYENVMWISGNHITVKNIHMKHFAPGTGESQNCSGRVIGFDNAHHVVIENCDLNGCGLAGLHDNLGNSDIHIRNNYIHNNSLGAYTDIDGGVWQKEVDDHPVFTFENNRMENNGPDRKFEPNGVEDYIVRCPPDLESDLIIMLRYEIEAWKGLENPFIAKFTGPELGDYFHLNFEDADGKSYDFGHGNNDYGDYELMSDEEEISGNPNYLNRQFKIYWNWRPSVFPCCEGEYVEVEAYYPSIVKLELVDEEKNK